MRIELHNAQFEKRHAVLFKYLEHHDADIFKILGLYLIISAAIIRESGTIREIFDTSITLENTLSDSLPSIPVIYIIAVSIVIIASIFFLSIIRTRMLLRDFKKSIDRLDVAFDSSQGVSEYYLEKRLKKGNLALVTIPLLTIANLAALLI